MANADGAVLKRVLPNVSPGAIESMRGPVEVAIRVSVNQHGAVSNAEYMTHGPGNYFARIARDAARSWKFTPPQREGQPQASVWNLRFRFERRNTDVTATELR
jgi:TonB family protein